jgi:imidazole glycerol-phosphate synthase subunit HisH
VIAIIDYGAGNLGSVYKAFKHIGADAVVTADEATVRRAERLVLPGVGAFARCMAGLEGVGLADATREFIASGRPFLGICVGMQMLFDESCEMGATPGLGVLEGRVVRFRFETHGAEASTCQIPKVPHIGWNSLRFRQDAPLFRGLDQGDRVYFVHSYYPEPAEPACVSATCEHGYDFCCAVSRDNVHATQFHPEKSGAVGLRILRNFVSFPT